MDSADLTANAARVQAGPGTRSGAACIPCVTIPVDTGPLGLQIVGRIGEDAATLAAAHWVGAVLANG